MVDASLFAVVPMLSVAGAWSSLVYPEMLPIYMLSAGIVQMTIGVFAGVLGIDLLGGLLTIALALVWWIAGALFFAARRSEL